MWPGQSPGGGTHPQGQHSQGQGPPGQHPQVQQPNPYEQPGYQQPSPYTQQQPGQRVRNAPALPSGTPEPPRAPKHRTTVIAVVAAAAVVIAACVTGFVLLGGGKDDKADPDPTNSPTGQATVAGTGDDDPGGTDQDEPTVPGWKVVTNPKRGIAFDVPADWGLKATSWVTYFTDDEHPDDDTPLIAMAAPAFLEEQWCGSDDDKDGVKDYTPLAGAGTKGNNGAKSTEDAARTDVNLWVYAAYTQPNRSRVHSGPMESYTTKSGLRGTLATASSSGVKKKGKCDTDGKATVFSFKNSEGDFVSWAFFGAKGVDAEVPDATVRKILSTVRLVKG